MKTTLLLILGAFSYTTLAQSSEMLPYRSGNEWGFANKAQQIQIKPKYDSVGFMFKQGGLDVNVAKVWKNGKVGITNDLGKELIKPKYNNLFINHYMVNDVPTFAGILVLKKGKYGVLNNEFKNQVKTTFDTLFFQKTQNKYSLEEFVYLGKEGGDCYILNAKFEKEGLEPEIYARLLEKVKNQARLPKIKKADFSKEYEELERRLPSFVERNIDSIDHAEISPFTPKVIRVYRDEKVGIVYTNQLNELDISHWILEPVYDEILEIKTYYNGAPYAYLARKNGMITLINDDYETVLEPRFDNYTVWNKHGLFLNHNGKKGYFRTEDQMLIEPLYDKIRILDINGRTFYEVSRNQRKNYLNEDGEELFSKSTENK